MDRHDGKVVHTRTYRGFEIRTFRQHSGRRTYDLYWPDSQIHSIAHESLRVAKAEIDAEVDR